MLYTRARLCIPLVAIAGFLSASDVHAQETSDRDFSAERFRLASDGDGILGTEDATVVGHLNWDVGLWMGWADDPLTVYRAMDGEVTRTDSLISRRIGGELVGAVGFKDRFQLGVQIPLIANQAFGFDGDPDDPPDVMLGPDSSIGIGDIRVLPKIQLLFADQHKVNLAFLPTFTIPTGTNGSYAGEVNFTFTPEVAVSRNVGAIRLASNLGYRVRQNTSTLGLDVWDEVYVRIAGGYIIGMEGKNPLELDLSMVVATPASDFFGSFNRNYSEVLAGAKMQVTPTWQAFAGGGVGTSSGYGAPDWRMLAGVRYVRRANDGDGDGVVAVRDGLSEQPDEPDDKD